MERNTKNKEELKRKVFKEECPFKPDINVVSRQLAEPTDRLDFEERVRKLAIVDREKHEYLMSQLKKEEEAKYNFKPALNKKSEQMAKNRDPNSLLDWNSREQKRLEKVKVEDT